ncbi:acyl-CoA dehydrogenase N-terminal domain-containing protein [Comamonas thiooxydans]|uniref:acyl-CoA dehydrogenase N-terminal domain-containing protein n=1 Tax=Comamonas thiooxydans TaxID=363952 RepID=UPI0022B24CFD|nr:acyl-CoA dehydrogenase N-terminal domain-containing protein [Comamonas thiooxydans]
MTYQAPIDDMLFCMKELAGLDATARLQGLEEVMPETAQACAKFTHIVIAPLNAAGGIKPRCLGRWLGEHLARLQMGLAAVDGRGLQAPAFGGQGLPSIGAACTEMLNSASMSFALCPLLPARSCWRARR